MIQSQPSTSTIPNQSVQKVEIIHYQTSTCNCHFTLCQKQGQTITIVSHSRILVYNQNTSSIYYINQLPKQPNKIQETLNKPKKESVVVNSVEFKNQAKSKILSIIFNKNGEKGNTVAVQWKFVMDGPAVAENWVSFIKNKKQQKIMKALAEYQKNQTQPKFLLDSNIPSDNKNINNTNNNITNSNNTTNPISTNNNTNNLNNTKVTINDQKNTNPNNTGPNNTNLNKINDPKMTNSSIVNNPISSFNQKQHIPPTNTESKPTTYNNTSSKIIQKNTYLSKEQSPPKPYVNTSQDLYNNTRQVKTTYQPTNIQRNPQESTIKKPIQKQYQPNLNISRESNQPSTYSNPNYTKNSNVNQKKQNFRINQSSNPPPNINTSYSRYDRSIANQKTQQPKPINITKIQDPKITENRSPTKYNMNSSNTRDKNKQNASNTNESNRAINRNSKKNQYPYSQRISDWNLQFLTNHNQTTLYVFSAYCLQIFQSLDPSSIVLSSYPQSRQSNPSKTQPLTLIRNNIVFQMAANRTKLSQKLKNQYNNYHYIVECCKNVRIINVPLCCIIQYLGIVCLAKVQIKYGGDGNADGEIVNLRDSKGKMTQKQKDIGQQLKILQMYTKISSQVIKKQAIIVNMSRVYGKQGNNYCIYIDNLYNYLPYHPQQPQLQIRPQLIIDNISSTLSSQQEHSQRQVQSALTQSFTQICSELSKHHILPISYIDIKNIIHSYGLTLSILPDLYGKVRSRFLKKYIYTILLCTILKDQITTSIIDFRQNNQSSGIIQSIEEALRIYSQIGANKDYEQIWKNMQKQFKKKYKINFNINEIQNGFFISTIMWMLGGQYNVNKLDKSKLLFQDNNIILEGFLIELKPKIKCYHRFMSQLTQRIITRTRNSQSTLDELMAILPEMERETPIQLLSLSSPVKQKVILHISKFLPPSPHSSHHPYLQSFIYSPQYINKQPPIQFTHQLTIMYANHCNRLGDHDQYKKTIQKSVDILSYWLGEDSVLLCDVFQSLGQYYGNKGNRDDCINFMKQALTTSIRSLGTHSTKVGLQYYKLAQKQLKYGDKAQAYETFLKSKQNLQQQNIVQSVYPLVLFKLGTLSLQLSNPQKCIIFSIQALKSCEHAPLPDKNLIKIYDLLSRAYELNHSKNQLNNLAHLSAKVFNNTNNPNLLQQMLRICLVGFIFTLQPIKQQKIQQYLIISGIIGLNNKMKVGQDHNNTEEQKRKIMKIGEKFVVMQKWYKQIQVIQRYVSQIKSKRPISGQGKQFMDMFGAIVKIVGVEFVEGVLTQAKYY